jgi:hypothetical protein
MKIFYVKLLIFQTIIYALFWFIGYSDALTENGKILFKPILIIGYSISVLLTFVIPMIKEYKKK